MNKKELRLEYKARRQKLTFDETEQMSLAIANKVLSLDIWEKNYFHIFLPIEEQKEVNTEYILHLLSGKDKETVISKSDFQTRHMTHFLLTDSTKIRKNQYNIPEPVDGIEVPPTKIDVVFVPLLAFDRQGHRVGYGKGFYDLFFSGCREDVIKVGLSYFGPENTIDGIFDWDVRLDFCVTPDRIYEF
ncbi:5-formyltetrahydrofolate cyclo-ligase [Flavobacterium humi]|uniref:5-formyltetrahydrofolate cyclo-ligase n=1 Tax=Flavobacterium humi TaxID=2562683 RepID=A0A4Z0L911_9FLAO|nr:5-formyltetrahydrofolate cyclo-ligase [Flavobacterium humi]TGD58509.1 5-formyltetrahydrofolate cyclo-ligase [Flavobacterium humi]